MYWSLIFFQETTTFALPHVEEPAYVKPEMKTSIIIPSTTTTTTTTTPSPRFSTTMTTAIQPYSSAKFEPTTSLSIDDGMTLKVSVGVGFGLLALVISAILCWHVSNAFLSLMQNLIGTILTLLSFYRHSNLKYFFLLVPNTSWRMLENI